MACSIEPCCFLYGELVRRLDDGTQLRSQVHLAVCGPTLDVSLQPYPLESSVIDAIIANDELYKRISSLRRWNRHRVAGQWCGRSRARAAAEYSDVIFPVCACRAAAVGYQFKPATRCCGDAAV
jgi:hypothetical protein